MLSAAKTMIRFINKEIHLLNQIIDQFGDIKGAPIDLSAIHSPEELENLKTKYKNNSPLLKQCTQVAPIQFEQSFPELRDSIKYFSEYSSGFHHMHFVLDRACIKNSPYRVTMLGKNPEEVSADFNFQLIEYVKLFRDKAQEYLKTLEEERRILKNFPLIQINPKLVLHSIIQTICSNILFILYVAFPILGLYLLYSGQLY